LSEGVLEVDGRVRAFVCKLWILGAGERRAAATRGCGRQACGNARLGGRFV
jgi:hypothetical protein